MREAAEILKSVFGYDSFRPLQREVIANILDRRDTLAVMPTGGGKSLCYQIPALVFPGLTVVVSPLVALMHDQIQQLSASGVPAVTLNSSLDPEEYADNMRRVASGEARLLYVAPETLLAERILELLARVRVDCLTIDEAHCISEWGHDFRPEYRQIATVRKRFPDAVCLALTATATNRVRADIGKSLGFVAGSEFVAGFDRPNLLIEVVPRRDAEAQILEVIASCPGQSGIIYCHSRKQVDDLAASLVGRGVRALPYHAGLDDATRRRNQNSFIRDDAAVMVATIAFGMGINKPDVRFVIHRDLPKSLENYYQEIGRAGRDGLPARCLLLYNYGDIAKQRHFIEQKEGAEREQAERHLETMIRYAEGHAACRRVPLLAHFGETYGKDSCGQCDVCRGGTAKTEDITLPAQKLLSCIVRTGERFGAAHVADVLLGSANAKVQQYGHDKLSTHGIGREWTKTMWTDLARELVIRGYLEQESEYRTLRLTVRAKAALIAREPIAGCLPGRSVPTAAVKTERRVMEHDAGLFAVLRERRKALADEAGMPPYMIFPDRTLIEMAARFPATRADLLGISGVGEIKAERYGDVFLAVIAAYRRQGGAT